ncbi:ABC transporter substrate-binding protein [Celerinatantimonas sp. MCCC 1A17872]|uniref:ABC transporter substrate-binding protein n=1 Tax=Celerinatantimonas sp. MCCC 1A17872 TaxID=3177514 RepID=UPI0038C8E5C4
MQANLSFFLKAKVSVLLALLICSVSPFALAQIRSSIPTVQSSQPRRIVTYYGHVKISVPQKIKRIACAWEAQNSILVMLGAGDKIVATTKVAKSIPAFTQIDPAIRHAQLVTMGGANDLNAEHLITLHPDILFVPEGFSKTKQRQLERAGIAVSAFHSNSMHSLIERVLITGKLLGPKAYQKALRYQAYFKHNEQLVSERLKSIPLDQRRSVYLASGQPLTTTGSPSLNQDWMDLSGAINIAKNWQLGSFHYGQANTNIESIIGANPDVIVTMFARSAKSIEHNRQWQTINAVKNGHVLVNPRGLFFWSRETSEQALQFLWMAKTLYPKAFSDIDMIHETIRFYQKFYDVTLTRTEAQKFLHPGPLVIVRH